MDEINKFKRLSKILESKNSNIVINLIGDDLIKYLNDDNFVIDRNLYSKNMKIEDLITYLSYESKKNMVDHVFLSIGKIDNFEKKEDISFLCEKLKNLYPNANISVIKSILDEDYVYIDKYDENFEKKINNYYDEFAKNGINVIGSYKSLDYKLNNINKIKKLISNYSYINNSDTDIFNIEKKDLNKPFFSKNIDIYGDDNTDYDTIYEFIDRFEKIVKSKNYYDTRTTSSFKIDIEQIQIILMFLNPSLYLNITGKFDKDTEEAVAEYQNTQKMDPTGICDTETLEEMLYDLKVKGFDDEDLSMYLSKLNLDDNLDDNLEFEIDKSDELVTGFGDPTLAPINNSETLTFGAEVACNLVGDLGISPFQAAAILGNLHAEGFPYPDRIQGKGIQRGKLVLDGKTGYGWAQWTSLKRQENLAKFASDLGVDYQKENLTNDINYDFLVQEFKDRYLSHTGLKNTETLKEAVIVILQKFENPKDQSTEVENKRSSYAQQYLNTMGCNND